MAFIIIMIQRLTIIINVVKVKNHNIYIISDSKFTFSDFQSFQFLCHASHAGSFYTVPMHIRIMKYHTISYHTMQCHTMQGNMTIRQFGEVQHRPTDAILFAWSLHLYIILHIISKIIIIKFAAMFLLGLKCLSMFALMNMFGKFWESLMPQLNSFQTPSQNMKTGKFILDYLSFKHSFFPTVPLFYFSIEIRY